MSNLFKRFFTHKSKFLLIILSLLGLAFSYSCSCRDNPYDPGPGGDDKKVDPKVFTISTNSVETPLVQKASDTSGKSFTYQPSIKFIEANSNPFTVSYEVTDDTGTFTKDKTSYDKTTGNITFTDLSSLTTDKKTITIKFTISATNTNLTNPTTNFTLTVDLKKTKRKLDAKTVIGETLVQDIATISLAGGTFEFYYKDIISTATASPVRATPPTGSDSFSVNKQNFKTDALSNMKSKNNGKSAEKRIPYSKAEFVSDADAGKGTHSFYLKFYFSDEDYELDEDQKDGIDYRLDVEGGQMDDGGGKKNKLTWI